MRDHQTEKVEHLRCTHIYAAGTAIRPTGGGTTSVDAALGVSNGAGLPRLAEQKARGTRRPKAAELKSTPYDLQNLECCIGA